LRLEYNDFVSNQISNLEITESPTAMVDHQVLEFIFKRLKIAVKLYETNVNPQSDPIKLTKFGPVSFASN
jgi:hypothetical protein